MSIHVLLATLRRHSLMPLLVLLQVALACAILSNVLFLCWQQLQPMLAPSGVDAANLIIVDRLDGDDRPWTSAAVHAGVQALREVPGVRAASAAGSLPMVTTSIYAYGLQGPSKVKLGVSVYAGEGLANTLGVQLLAGRDFLPDEYRAEGGYKGTPEPVIVTQALARKLFGNADALGQRVADPENPTGAGYQVVGIVRHLLRNQLGMGTNGRADDTMLIPQRVGDTPMPLYGVRVDPAMREAWSAGSAVDVHVFTTDYAANMKSLADLKPLVSGAYKPVKVFEDTPKRLWYQYAPHPTGNGWYVATLAKTGT
mgnify:CR=1 FL=1